MTSRKDNSGDRENGPAVINRQRVVPLSAEALHEYTRALQREVAGGRAFSVCLVSDHTIRRYNRKYRGKDEPTDVLSFPDEAPDWAGDVMISAETAARQARRLRHSVETEIKILALHGVLHLLGYDHEDAADRGRMARVENRWRAQFALPGGLIERASV